MSQIRLSALLVFVITFNISYAAYIRCYGDSMDEYDEYDLDEAERILNSKYFKKDYYTFVFIHGYQGEVDGRAVTGMVTAAIERGGWNVCILNWSKEASSISLLGDSTLAQSISYSLTGAENAARIGVEYGRTLIRLSDIGWDLDKTHIHAHSLGAHLAGFAGRTVKESDKEIGHITGLDPSRPLFENPTLIRPLASGSAKFVDCVHSDPGGLGVNTSRCDMDQWPNYGRFLVSDESERVQPGCPEGNFEQFSEEDSCSHDFSWRIIAQSWEDPELFIASYAEDYWEWVEDNGTGTPVTNIGEQVNKDLRGDFFFRTKGVPPYGIGKEGLYPKTEQRKTKRSSLFKNIL